MSPFRNIDRRAALVSFEYYGEIGVPLYPSVAWDQVYMPALGLDIGLPPDADRFSRIWLIEAFGFRAAAEGLVAAFRL